MPDASMPLKLGCKQVPFAYGFILKDTSLCFFMHHLYNLVLKLVILPGGYFILLS